MLAGARRSRGGLRGPVWLRSRGAASQTILICLSCVEDVNVPGLTCFVPPEPERQAALSPSVGSMKRYANLVLIGIILGGIVAGVLYARSWANRKLNRELLLSARMAMDMESFEQAEAYASRLIARSPSVEARLIAGDAAMAQQRYDEALQYFEPLLEGEGESAVTALCA